MRVDRLRLNRRAAAAAVAPRRVHRTVAITLALLTVRLREAERISSKDTPQCSATTRAMVSMFEVVLSDETAGTWDGSVIHASAAGPAPVQTCESAVPPW